MLSEKLYEIKHSILALINAYFHLILFLCPRLTPIL